MAARASVWSRCPRVVQGTHRLWTDCGAVPIGRQVYDETRYGKVIVFSLLCSCFYSRRCAMGARWLLAMAAYSGLAWAGMVYGACNQELLQKLLDRGFSND